MSVLRTEQQATLAELHGRGEELLQRYEAAAQFEALPDALRNTLAQIAAQRKLLVQALADLERLEDDLPKAGNVERAAVEEVVDRISRTVGAERALADRLADADRQWLVDVDRAMTLDWSADEADLIGRLASHLRDAVCALEEI